MRSDGSWSTRRSSKPISASMRGSFPTQTEANLQAIQNAQMQLQAISESMNRDRDRRMLLERQIADLETTESPVAAVPQPAPMEALARIDGAAARGSQRTAAAPADPVHDGSP